MSSDSNALQLMFYRPCEPIFTPKDDEYNNPTIFDMPDSFYEGRYKNLCHTLKTKYNQQGTKKVKINNVSAPDISFAKDLGLKDNFSVFIPKHNTMACSLTEILMKQRTIKDLLSVTAYYHDRINPYLYNYALSVAMLHRTDTRNYVLPNLMEIFPEKLLSSNVFAQARQETEIVPTESRQPIEMPQEQTANSKEPEQRIAYFREDIGVSLHYWHWHLVYPTEAPDNIVKKNRRGELFYYMHHQILARYNAERLSNKLNLVHGYDLKGSIVEGYFSKLERLVARKALPPRLANITPKDVDWCNDNLKLKLSIITEWEKNITNAIKKGSVQDTRGKSIFLNDENGIDILGNAVQASTLSPNRKLYGDLNSMAHLFISMCHDPNGKYLEGFGVMGESATAMRDPVFYRWHKHINDIFLMHKDTLPKYTIAQLEYKDIYVTDVNVMTGSLANEFHTFWQKSDVDISRGLDFTPSGALRVRVNHLQHEPFTYSIKVNNKSSSQLVGTMRIFMAPKHDSNGHVMSFEDQRKLMIELDKFKVTLKHGDNTITRKSEESSVTIPYERTFRNLDTPRTANQEKLKSFNFCGCGWPQHMLIPKGATNGMVFDLFAMISNWAGDKVDQDITGYCNDAESYCGIQDKLYPDKRSMGYPFDRVGRTGVKNLSDFLTPNMKFREVVIKFTEKTVIKALPKKEITVISAKRN